MGVRSRQPKLQSQLVDTFTDSDFLGLSINSHEGCDRLKIDERNNNIRNSNINNNNDFNNNSAQNFNRTKSNGKKKKRISSIR